MNEWTDGWTQNNKHMDKKRCDDSANGPPLQNQRINMDYGCDIKKGGVVME